MPQDWVNCIENSTLSTVVNPCQTINLHGGDNFLQYMGSEKIYKILIDKSIRIPIGVVRWRTELALSVNQLKTAFTFAKLCSSSIFDCVFQYKIVTQILPTQKYLHRYKVEESELCLRCFECADSVYHNLWQCSRLTSYLSACFVFLRSECNQVDEITAENYLFGFIELNRVGINHVLLELKKLVFYSCKDNISVVAFRELFLSKIRSLIIKEKNIAHSNNKYATFCSKWDSFTAFYDFRGPDLQILFR